MKAFCEVTGSSHGSQWSGIFLSLKPTCPDYFDMALQHLCHQVLKVSTFPFAQHTQFLSFPDFHRWKSKILFTPKSLTNFSISEDEPHESLDVLYSLVTGICSQYICTLICKSCSLLNPLIFQMRKWNTFPKIKS